MAIKYSLHKRNENGFGGGDFLIDIWDKAEMNSLIVNCLGVRSPRAEYTYAEGILSFFITQCRQNRRIEKFYESQLSLKQHPRFNKAMSPDTFLYMCKELSSPKKIVPILEKSPTKERRSKKPPYENHEVIVNKRLNELLINAAIKLKLLDPSNKQGYLMDFDATEIYTKTRDARRTYKGKGKRGYCPSVAYINNIPLYIENRNGNTNAGFNIVNAVFNALNLVRSKGLKVHTLRLDSAAFTKEFVEFCGYSNVMYLIRAKSDTVKAQASKINNWKEASIDNEKVLVGDTTFFFGNEETRIVMKKLSAPKIDEEGAEQEYWGVITNNFEMANESLLKCYSDRGASEHIFRELKSFGWSLLPMRKIEFNTVYLYITAFNYSFFRYVTQYGSKVMPRLEPCMQFETFKERFMRVTTCWKGKTLSFSENAKDYMRLLSAFP